jgi:rubredoxin
MSERCEVCGRYLSDLLEDGCEQCGLEYDPLQPDFNKELDFDRPKFSSDPWATEPDVFDELEEE